MINKEHMQSNEMRRYMNKQRLDDLKMLYVKILKYKYRVFRVIEIGNDMYEIDIETTDTSTQGAQSIGIFVSPPVSVWI